MIRRLGHARATVTIEKVCFKRQLCPASADTPRRGRPPQAAADQARIAGPDATRVGRVEGGDVTRPLTGIATWPSPG